MQLYPQQQRALTSICDFLDSDNHVFILKGYAGTGKTTIIKCLIPKLEAIGKAAMYMAPTGRAAKILREKIGEEVFTIHKSIYVYSGFVGTRHDDKGDLIKVEEFSEEIIKEQEKHLVDTMDIWFQVQDYTQDVQPDNVVIIVDEASMISSKRSTHEIYHFGTDILLDDLMTFARLNNGAKIIFVGDDAQLPPVGDNESVALKEEYFNELGYKTQSITLTEVVRQAKDSAILDNAMLLRDLLRESQRNRLQFTMQDGVFETITASDIVNRFVGILPTPEMGVTAVLCYSNSMVNEYNTSIRSRYFGPHQPIQVGDILQVVRNRYGDENKASFYNGDFVKVIACSGTTETQSAPVWVEHGSGRVRQTINLTFRDITIIDEHGRISDVKIIDSLLHSPATSLLPNEIKALYINFRLRHPDLKVSSEVFTKELIADPYYNALNVKYGYAITVHKSQGGEWNKVFVDYTGRAGLNNDCIRWMYTATTRAKETLYGVNIPNIQPFDKLRFSPITKLSKPSNSARVIADIGDVEHLPLNATNFQKAKYLSISAALNALGYSIDRVECLPYKDRYHIALDNKIVRYDCIYNGAGFYTKYSAIDVVSVHQQIIEALQQYEECSYRVNYTPSNQVLVELYNKIQSCCDDLSIIITNIVEDIKQYNVTYYLKTSGYFSQIKFYFNDKSFITYGQPGSDMGTEDMLLNELINKLG